MMPSKLNIALTTEDVKRCPRCRRILSLDAFPLDPGSFDGHYGYCKPCKAEYMRAYTRAMPKEQRARHNLTRLLRMNEMTVEEYEQMAEEQGGKCAICGTKVPGQNASRLLFDHNHATGKVRGLLCHGCNRGLGFFVDSPERLRAAAQYLERVSQFA